MTAGRRLVLLRHGETTHNAAGIWQGQLDVPLNDHGRVQAAAAAVALATRPVARIVSSDLVRAAETAHIVAEVLGRPVALDARFREIEAGQWQGRTSAEVQAAHPELWAAVLRGEDVPRGVTGETMADVARRGAQGVTDVLAATASGERVLVVTHGAACRAIVADLLGLDVQSAWRILGGLGNCHWAELVEGGLGWRVATWNIGPAVPADGADLA